MQQDDIKLEAFTADHVSGALALSKQAAWPHRREDWEVLLGVSQAWAAIGEAGEVVGTSVFTPFGATGGALSMIIVSASLRGRGIGRRLFSTALEAAKGRRLRLTATPDGAPLYRSLGFKPSGQIFQHQGVLTGVPESGSAEDAIASDEGAIVQLDAAAFGEDRRALIHSLWQVGRFAVIRENGAVQAFGCARDFGRGTLIGPIVAASAHAAEALIGHLAAGLQGSFVRLDITADTGLEKRLAELGLPLTDNGLVMWTEDPSIPATDAPRTIALASQALG